MKRRTLIASIGAVAGTTLGAAAYSSATVTRSATINVSNDSGALIALNAGDSEYISEDIDSGLLSINLDNLNQNSTFTFGDDSGLSADSTADEYAFSIRNDGTYEREITLAYDGDSGGDGTVTFDVYGPDYSEGGESAILASGATAYVILTVSTGTADLSGDLTITASEPSAAI